MGMNVQHNLQAMNAHRNMSIANTKNSKAQEKLASGYRINRAGDDAAGLAISEKMRGQIKGLTQSSRNAQDGISLIQTAEGALGTTHDILQRMRELAVQSSNDTNTDDDRAEIQKEVNELTREITRISTDTEFNTMKLLNGKFTSKKFHVGANQGQNITLTVKDMSASALGILGTVATGKYGVKSQAKVTGVTAVAGKEQTYSTDGSIRQTGKFSVAAILSVASVTGVTRVLNVQKGDGLNVSTQTAANTAITTINNAILKVSAERSKLGANQNRLEYTSANLDIASENLQASEARIRDVDMASEVLKQTQTSVLQQAAQSMLAMANQQPQSVLSLLQ